MESTRPRRNLKQNI
jgi:hypothetical protein